MNRSGAPTGIAGSAPGALGGAGMVAPPGAAGAAAVAPGTCCPDGDCLCRAAPPSALSAEPGPHTAMQYDLSGVGCVHYPSDAAPPLAAVAIADGFGGSGGCASVQTDQWGPLYASHGIVAIIIETGTGDQPELRGKKLGDAIAALEAENQKGDSALFGKLAGRYGTSGFSNGGGGSTFATQADSSLLSSVVIMPWGPSESGGKVPTLIICGESDGVAPCTSYGAPAYAGIDATAPKMRVSVAGGHNGQPSAGGGNSGAYGLAFQKLFLEGDERWRPLLVAANAEETTLQ
jgi:hypothetical protein